MIWTSSMYTLVHGACPCPCCMSMSNLYINVHAAGSSPCSTDVDKQQIQEHAEWTWTRSIYWETQYGHGHAVWTWTRTSSMYLSMLHVYVHTACQFPCCMFVSMLLYMSKSTLKSMSVLNVHVRSAGTWTYSTGLNMQHGHLPINMDVGMLPFPFIRFVSDSFCYICFRS
jgi:hypothetical protein